MNSILKNNAIFVSIASYRDPVCNITLKSLFEMAKNPKKIYVGICQQNKEDDEDCLLNFENNTNIKILRISHLDAKGPTYARYLCSTLWNGEEYYLQIDSHTKFVQNWDEKCINMIKKIKELGLSNKPVLSHYPNELGEFDSYIEKKNEVPRMCKAFFNDREMISFMGAEVINTNNKFYQTPYVAGGMLFAESYFLNELPYDPELPYLFVGEEILHSIRFYTYGWDIFTPTENIIFHEYTRQDKPKIWTDNPSYSDSDAFEKVKFYIGLVDNDSNISDDLKLNIHKYGLGNVRSLNEYYNFAGINLKEKIVEKNFCRENNIASEEDILKSNEKKSENIENYNNNKDNKNNNKNKLVYQILFIIFFIILLVFFILTLIKIR